MTRYCEEIGYGFPVEESSELGVWVDAIIERTSHGDVVRTSRKLEDSGNLHSNIVVDNSISIVADTFAISNFPYIKYAMFMGVRWTVTNIEVRRPRLILTLGEVYNGPTPP